MKNNFNPEMTRREFIGIFAGAAAGLYGISLSKPKKSSAGEQKELEGKVEELAQKYKAAIEGGKITFDGYETLTEIIVGKKNLIGKSKGIGDMLQDSKYESLKPKLENLKEDVLTAIHAYLREGQVSLGFYYDIDKKEDRSIGMKLDGSGIDQQIITEYKGKPINPIQLKELLKTELKDENKIYKEALKKATTEFITVNTNGEWDFGKQEKYWTKLPNTPEGWKVAMILYGDQIIAGRGAAFFMNPLMRNGDPSDGERKGAEIQITLSKEVKYSPK